MIEQFQFFYPASQLSALSSQLSALSSQLSALSSQLSALSSQLSALSSQLSAPRPPPPRPFSFHNVFAPSASARPPQQATRRPSMPSCLSRAAAHRQKSQTPPYKSKLQCTRRSRKYRKVLPPAREDNS